MPSKPCTILINDASFGPLRWKVSDTMWLLQEGGLPPAALRQPAHTAGGFCRNRGFQISKVFVGGFRGVSKQNDPASPVWSCAVAPRGDPVRWAGDALRARLDPT